MKMREQILKEKDSAPIQFKFFELCKRRAPKYYPLTAAISNRPQ